MNGPSESIIVTIPSQACILTMELSAVILVSHVKYLSSREMEMVAGIRCEGVLTPEAMPEGMRSLTGCF